MDNRRQHDLITQTLSLMKDQETKIDWLVKQILQIDQTHVSFKQKKRRLILLANHLVKLEPLAMVHKNYLIELAKEGVKIKDD